jgi:L-lactate dehydrogenase (cytochrome)
MARRRLPAIFHYIDGAADDEVTYRRNTEAYERCDIRRVKMSRSAA